jgi:hypothetical protein
MTLISNGDGTYTAAPLDVLMILHDVVAGTYHAAFFEEAPLPGNATSVRSVRLRCRMHRLRGAPSLGLCTDMRSRTLVCTKIAGACTIISR